MDEIPSPLTDDFLLTLVHDLRAHVRRSLTSVQLAARSAGPLLDAESRPRFDQAIEANRDLEKFLARLADYAGAAHASGGRPLPLSVVVQAALLQFPSHSFELGAFPMAAQQIMVPPEIVRTLIELIDNALKFSHNAPVSILMEETADTVCVVVCDSGVGIPLEHQDRVFDLLFRLHSRDEFPGFGLGLPICRRTAGLAGARVGVAPGPGGGTRATLFIPTTHH